MDSQPRSIGQTLLLVLLIGGAGCQSSPTQGTEPDAAKTSTEATSPDPKGTDEKGFLVVNYEESKVVLLDKDGKTTWQLKELFYPSDAKMLSNGNILIAEQADGAVREYNREGEVVWEYRGLQRPRAASRLANGNILIADPTGGRVLVVTPDKKIVWELNRRHLSLTDFRPYHAARLSNGNTLVVDFGANRVFEVNLKKQVVWEFGGQFLDAERLPNGNTLLCQSTKKGKEFRALEVSTDKKIVWEIKTIDYPYDVDRLANGNTMVAEEGGTRIYDKDGKLVRTVYKSWCYEADKL